MKVAIYSAIVMSLLLEDSQAVQFKHQFKHMKKARKDEKPPPDQPGGLSDDRYTSHWRKPWPQGVDDSAGDDEVLSRFNKPDPRKIKEKKVEKYPWEYDKDVIETGKSIE